MPAFGQASWVRRNNDFVNPNEAYSSHHGQLNTSRQVPVAAPIAAPPPPAQAAAPPDAGQPQWGRRGVDFVLPNEMHRSSQRHDAYSKVGNSPRFAQPPPPLVQQRPPSAQTPMGPPPPAGAPLVRGATAAMAAATARPWTASATGKHEPSFVASRRLDEDLSPRARLKPARPDPAALRPAGQPSGFVNGQVHAYMILKAAR